jgi:hypothetical protein
MCVVGRKGEASPMKLSARREDIMNTSFARALSCSFIIAGSVLPLETVRAQAIFRTEVYPIQTVTLSTADFLLGNNDGKPAMIAGEPRMPKSGTDRLPANSSSKSAPISAQMLAR